MPQMHAPRYVSPHVTHVARDAFFGTTRRRTRPRPLAVYRRIRATSVRFLSCFVLDRCLPRGVLVVYIFPLARPLAKHRNTDCSFPLFAFTFSPPLASSCPFRLFMKPAVEPLEQHGPFADCVATECSSIPLAYTHTRMHLTLPSCVPRTHSPVAARITIRVHRSPSIPVRVLFSGTQPVLSSFPYLPRIHT